MAEGTSSPFGFLGNKVGPLPLFAWMAAGIGVWYFITKKNSGTATTAGQQPTNVSSNYGTDPAGNTGYIDPNSGYVYGTSEDTAALQGSGSGTTATSPSSSGQTYTDNDAWGRAAVNYLVGVGEDPTQANQAITLYLSSQPLNTQQQAMVNSAIQAIGAPPSLPGPAASNPGGVVTPPGSGGGGGGGGGGKPQPPKNLKLSGNNGTSAQVSWDLPGGLKDSTWLVQNHLGSSTGAIVDSFTTNNTIANLGGALAKPAGLKPGTRYTVVIKMNSPNAPAGTLSYTTNRATTKKKG